MPFDGFHSLHIRTVYGIASLLYALSFSKDLAWSSSALDLRTDYAVHALTQSYDFHMTFVSRQELGSIRVSQVMLLVDGVVKYMSA